jgi:hypothetical protein
LPGEAKLPLVLDPAPLTSSRPHVTPILHIVHPHSRRAVDQKAEQFRSNVVSSRVHHMLPLVDQRDIGVHGEGTFARGVDQ